MGGSVFVSTTTDQLHPHNNELLVVFYFLFKNIYIFLIFLDPGSFTNVSNNASLLEGKDLQLFCDASGMPSPIISWVRISPSGSESSVFYRGTSLDFKNISRTEAGTYRCTASNGVGSPVTRILQINVQCEYMYIIIIISYQYIYLWLC